MNIFQKVWETIKSIPEQYKAAGQLISQKINPQKLTASVYSTPPVSPVNLPSKVLGGTQESTGVGDTYTPEFIGVSSTYNPATNVYNPTWPSTYSSYTQPYYTPAATSPGGGTTAGRTTTGGTTTGGTTTGGTTTGGATYQQPSSFSPPPQAPSGQAGYSYEPYTPYSYSFPGYSYAPAQAPSGQAGASAHTGLLGGVTAGLGITLPTTEEKNKEITVNKGAYINPITQQSVPYGTPSQGYTAQGQPITSPIAPPNLGQTANAFKESSANVQQQQYKQQGLTIPETNIPPKTNLSLPPITTPEGALDLGAIQQGVNQITTLLKSPLTQQSLSDVSKYLSDVQQTLFVQLKQLKPTPDEPILKPEAVTDDPNQKAQLDQWYELEKQQYEDIQRALGIPDLIKQYEDSLKQIQATDEAFNKVIKEINDDPDFPKGLAKRRIDTLSKEQTTRITALQNQAQLLQTTLQLKSNEFVQRMNMVQSSISRQISTQQNQQQTQRTNAQKQVDDLIQTKAIANMTDAQLTQLAQASGYTFDSLKNIRDTIKTQEAQKAQKAQKATQTKTTIKTFTTPTNADFQGFVNWLNSGGIDTNAWNTIRNSWIANGFDPTLFDKYFETYNPTKKSSSSSIDEEWNKY